jgi:tetratricopeptide (TPR) repeat protein/O-antigen ligase
LSSNAPRVDAGAILEALPEAIALTLLAALPAFINLASERIFEEEKALLIRGAALLALPGAILAWRRRGAPLLRHPAVITFGALTLALLVAAIAAAAPHDAFVGAYLRRHGFLTWLALAIAFAAMCTAARTPAGRDRLVAATVLGSIWPCGYALLQRAHVDPIGWIAASSDRVGSTFGNPIFLGGYLAMVLPLTLVLARRRRIAVPLLALQFAALATTASRGAFVALVAGLFVYGVVSAWSAPRGRAIAIAALVLAAVTASALAAFPSARPASVTRVLDPSTGTGRVRVLIWKNVLTLMEQGGPRRWIGYGPESLHHVFPPYYPAELGALEGTDALPDRAHNELLDTFVSAGLAGLVFEIAFFVTTIVAAVSLADRAMRAALAAASVAHIVEIQFGIATVVTRLLFLTVAAIAVGFAAGAPERVAAARMVPRGVARRRAAITAAGGQRIAPAGIPWRWLALTALIGALSPLVSTCASIGQPSMGAGTADALIEYLATLSWGTPLAFGAMLAMAVLLAWSIADATRPAAHRWLLGWSAAAGIVAAIPVSITPSRADVFSKAAAAFESRQQWTEAVVAYREAVRLQPAQGYYHTGLGRALTQGAIPLAPEARDARFRAAREAFERAQALDPSDPDHPRHLASLERIRAWTLTGGARAEPLAEADRLYAQAIALAPGLPALWVERAHGDLEGGRQAQAMEKLTRALALDAERRDAWLLWAEVQRSQRNFTEALAAYDRVVARPPLDIDALRGRALMLAELDRPGEAMATLSRVLQIAPADSASLQLRDRLAGRVSVSGPPR